MDQYLPAAGLYLSGGASLTFAEFCEEFLAVYRATHPRMTYTSLFARLMECFGPVPLALINKRRIEEYRARRLATISPTTHRPILPSTVNREIGLLRVILRRAVEWERLRHDPCAGIRKLRTGGPRERALSRLEAVLLLAACEPNLRALVGWILQTGMRPGEATALRWQDVDPERRCARVRFSKNGKDRAVPISDEAIRILQFRPPGTGTERVFTTRTGAPWYATNLRRSFAAARNRIGLEATGPNKVTPHTLRHTCASWLSARGVRPAVIRDILGHSSLAQTSQYVHTTEKERLAAVESLADETRKRGGIDTPLPIVYHGIGMGSIEQHQTGRVERVGASLPAHTPGEPLRFARVPGAPVGLASSESIPVEDSSIGIRLFEDSPAPLAPTKGVRMASSLSSRFAYAPRAALMLEAEAYRIKRRAAINQARALRYLWLEQPEKFVDSLMIDRKLDAARLASKCRRDTLRAYRAA